ncbi:hypothetical protein LPJ72_005876, partial [Coemansia sp. Benny D160-2]
PSTAGSAEPAKIRQHAPEHESYDINEIRDDDDEWTKRIKRTGCHMENERLILCHVDGGDWRKCGLEMSLFKQCIRRNESLLARRK